MRDTSKNYDNDNDNEPSAALRKIPYNNTNDIDDTVVMISTYWCSINIIIS